MGRADPYVTLGVDPSASDAELRAAYRRLVQRHHPDHNGGSPESARRFEQIQEAYARVRDLRASRPRPSGGGSQPSGGGPGTGGVDSRLADIERELAAARAARARAAAEGARAAREREAARERARAAAAEALGRPERPRRPGRPSDEELGYITTDDSFSKILADAAAGLSDRLSNAASGFSEQLAREAHERRAAKRVSDLIDELGSKLTGD